MKKGNRILFWALAILALYFLPYILLLQDAHFDSHDSLDYYVAIIVSAVKSGELWNLNPLSTVSPILGGIPRYCFHNNIDVLTILFSVFPPFAAFLINFILVHLIGFLGMYILLKKHFLSNTPDSIVIPGTALVFSFLPLYPTLGITLSGLPLLIFAILNIYKNQNVKMMDYLLIIFFALYSSLVYVGVFIIIVLVAAFIVDWAIHKKPNARLFYVTCTIVVSYLVFNYYLVYQMLFAKGFVSDRTEWIIDRYNYKVSIWSIFNMLFNGHYHAQSLHFFILVIAVPLGLGYGMVKKLDYKLLAVLMVLAVLWACFYGFWQWDMIVKIKEKILILNIFQWDRFYFFNPTLWCLILALSLILLQDFKMKGLPAGRCLVISILAFQLIYVSRKDEYLLKNYSTLINKITGKSNDVAYDTYRGYYQEHLFKEIDEYIHRPKNSYKVGSIALNPAVPQYNGFYTIDGYMTSYPLEYKHKFRKIIEKELAKNEPMRLYFDGWGSRCYLWVAELWSGAKEINNLELNTSQLKELQCQYIISGVKIVNNESPGMELLKTFKSDVNGLEVYLYSIK